MRPFKSLWRAMALQHLARQRVGHVAESTFLARQFQLIVDAFERVGGVFGVGVEEFEQHLARVGDEAWCTARAQAQQAEHGHVRVVDGEQHALL